MTRLVLPSGLALWVGATLLLSRLRWFARPPLVERLRPYAPGATAPGARAGVLSFESFRDVVGPVARAVGERLSRVLGIAEDLAVRLERIHSPLDVTAFRVRQIGWSLAGFGVGTLVAVASTPPPVVALLLALGAPVLAFLMLEQQVAAASARRQRRLFLELPVVAEQLAMLLTSGFSLGAALNRVAARGTGVCAQDLARVCGRVRQGLTEVEALAEWAAVVRVPALDRLLPVVALNRQATDLGRLLSEEARAVRRDVQRELVETVERRGQQVWIPVTVATLLPGVTFLTIPFLEALRLFSGS
jgi:Flp pilus assembly protein TadB